MCRVATWVLYSWSISAYITHWNDVNITIMYFRLFVYVCGEMMKRFLTLTLRYFLMPVIVRVSTTYSLAEEHRNCPDLSISGNPNWGVPLSVCRGSAYTDEHLTLYWWLFNPRAMTIHPVAITIHPIAMTISLWPACVYALKASWPSMLCFCKVFTQYTCTFSWNLLFPCEDVGYFSLESAIHSVYKFSLSQFQV